MKITYKNVKPMNVRSRLLSYNKKNQITNINMKTLKLLINASFFDKINDFMCFNIWSEKVRCSSKIKPRLRAEFVVVREES